MDSTAGDHRQSAGRTNLDAFLATLSPWDLLYLRDKFRTGKIPIVGLAGLPDLPAEILSLIVTQLALEDIVSCRLVSRAWHSSWTQGAVITAISHFIFPGLIEKHKQFNDSKSLQDLVQSSMAKSLRRRHAQPYRASFIFWRERSCPVFKTRAEQEGQTPDWRRTSYYAIGPPVFYEGGRLVWQVNDVNIVIDELRTCERRYCNLMEMHLRGQKLVLQGMSREMLVFIVKQGPAGFNYNTIQVWHVELDEWRRVALPGPFVRCFVEGERAAFVTRQGLVIAWSWKDGASEVDLSDEMGGAPEDYERGRGLPGVILHPDRADTLYVASIFRSKLKNTGIFGAPHSQRRRFLMSVVKYECGNPVKKFQQPINDDSLSNTHHDSIYIPFRITLLCSKMGPNGLYNLGKLLTASYDVDSPRVVELAAAGFNIYKESFIQRKFIKSTGNGVIDRLQFHFEPSVWGLCNHEELLTTWSEGHASIPRWVSLDSADRRLDGAAQAADDVSLYLKELNKCVPVSEPCRVYGDDDFQVHVTTQGILAWSFTEETRLPAMDGPSELGEMIGDSSWLEEPVLAVDLRPFAG